MTSKKDHQVQVIERASWGWTMWWLVLAGVVIGLDQFSKQIVSANLAYLEEIEVLPFFSWVHWQNPGAAFSFLDEAGDWKRWFFLILAAGFCGYLLWELRRLRRTDVLSALAFALIIGGAIGNAIDRAVLGFVVDFLKFHWGTGYFPAFNLADSAIFLGAVLWFTQIWREGREAASA